MQANQLLANVGRAATLVLLVPLWPLAAVATISATLPQWWANWRLRRLVAKHAELTAKVDQTVRARLLTQLKRTMPGSAYYALSGQLTVWLISLFGQASGVAAVGALGRLVMVLGILTTTFGILVAPRFARIPIADQARVRRRYWQAQLLLLAACALPVALLACFPGPALMILGPHYLGLESEAILMGVAGVVTTLSGAAFTLGAARGIIAPPWIAIPASLLVQAILVLLLPVSTIKGVIWLGLISAAFQWILHTAYFLHGQRRAATS